MDDDDDDLLLACSMEPCDSQLSQLTHKSGKKAAKVSSSFKTSDPWISSSFGDFEGLASTSKNGSDKTSAIPARKKSKQSKPLEPKHHSTKQSLSHTMEKTREEKSFELWADKHKPHSQSMLAVHKKKIQELQDWLQFSINSKHKQAPILLLTGPAGAGKTASLVALSQELAIEVQEWSTPDVHDYDSESWNREDFPSIGGTAYVSQTSQFQDFLLRANRYPSLQIFNQDQLHRKLILVEDFPNVFFRNTSSFHDIIRNYQKCGRCPLVFIISDSAAGSSNERLLFPKDVQEDLNISNISFNPVAQTNMVKVMTAIASSEVHQSNGKIRMPSKSTMEALATASAGDVRGAINALQFACLKDTTDLSEVLASSSQISKKFSTSSSSRSRKKGQDASSLRKQVSATRRKQAQAADQELSAIGGRDTSLFLFRALGKVLYCKRGDPADFPDAARLPEHLSSHYRDPLLVNTEDILDKAQVSAEFFTAFLHQNYLDFYQSLDDVIQASEYLSDADYLTTEWVNRSVLREYAGSVAARGLMFCNSARSKASGGGPSGLGWKPLHKPQWFEVNKKCRTNKQSSQELFRLYGWTPEELHMNFLPYVTLVNLPFHAKRA